MQLYLILVIYIYRQQVSFIQWKMLGKAELQYEHILKKTSLGVWPVWGCGAARGPTLAGPHYAVPSPDPTG